MHARVDQLDGQDHLCDGAASPVLRRAGGGPREKRDALVAVVFTATITFLAPTGLYLFGATAFDSQGYFGTLCSFGFMVVYILVSIAAPLYLRGIGEPSRRALIVSALAVAFMMLPFLGAVGLPGSSIFPPPVYPNNLLLWLFVAYMAIGFSWFVLQRALRPNVILAMTRGIELIDRPFVAVHDVPHDGLSTK
jgi:hypothetical protein